MHGVAACRSLAVAAVCALGASPLPAQGGRPRFDPAVVERGRAQYKSSCGFCHGDDATGNRAPDLIRSPLLAHDADGDLLGPLIRNGRPEKGMPGQPTVTPAQIADIAVFLHSQAFRALSSAGVPRDYPLEKLLTGNAEAGKAYFNGPGGCAACHSPTGDLKGIAGRFSPVDLQQRMIYPGNRPVTAIVTLPNGQKAEGKVAHHDEFEIAIRGADGWYRSWKRSAVKVELRDPMAAHRALMEKLTDRDIHNLFAYLVTLK